VSPRTRTPGMRRPPARAESSHREQDARTLTACRLAAYRACKCVRVCASSHARTQVLAQGPARQAPTPAGPSTIPRDRTQRAGAAAGADVEPFVTPPNPGNPLGRPHLSRIGTAWGPGGGPGGGPKVWILWIMGQWRGFVDGRYQQPSWLLPFVQPALLLISDSGTTKASVVQPSPAPATAPIPDPAQRQRVRPSLRRLSISRSSVGHSGGLAVSVCSPCSFQSLTRLLVGGSVSLLSILSELKGTCQPAARHGQAAAKRGGPA